MTPAANAGPRRRARPCDVSAARPLASTCHVDVWGGIPTSRPRPDRNIRGTRRANGDREAQAAAWKGEGGTAAGAADNTVATGEGGDGEERGRQGTAVHFTYNEKRYNTERDRQHVEGIDGGRRDGWVRAGI